MALTDFSGSDMLVVIAAVGAAGATIVGAWMAARRKPQEGEEEDLADFRAYVAKTFVPRDEFTEAIQNTHDARHSLRNEMQASMSNYEGRIRIEIRDLGLRVDQLMGNPRRR